ncbi:MAG: acetyl-CoA decarbonylase/synthase complex subunit gamma [Coriobacteriia bacterium]|nr:acetyl-CoA decarbonylase/synthase complex subunit gamma [Coriobacteriia bacterium]
MALSGLDIFKKLPKTNCGDCGVPTCLAFAMKLAASQAELTACPHVSEEAAAELSDASAPPIRGVTVGVGERAFKVGEETVLYRHDRTFVNPTAFGVLVDAASPDEEIEARVREADSLGFERVQQHLSVSCLVVRSSGEAARFREVVSRVSSLTDLPLVLSAEAAAEMEAALSEAAASRPLLHGATAESLDAMAELAKRHECPLALRGTGDLASLAATAERAAEAGCKDLVLDPGSATAADGLRDLVFIRRSALERKFRALGYPVITFPALHSGGDPMLEAMYAATHVAKYAGIVVLSGAEPWRMLPLLVLRQNLYTDPQRPMQVEQRVYDIGSPDADAPLLVTTNFSLSYFIVSSEVEASGIPAHLGVVDAEGLSVLTAWAAGKFVPDSIAAFLKGSDVTDRLSHRRVIIPGLVAQISGELAECLGDSWEVTVGPAEAADIPAFLRQLQTTA